MIVQFKDGADSFRARHNVALYLSDAELPDGVQPELSPDADALGEILRFRIEAKDKDIDLIAQKSYEDWEIYKKPADRAGRGGHRRLRRHGQAVPGVAQPGQDAALPGQPRKTWSMPWKTPTAMWGRLHRGR